MRSVRVFVRLVALAGVVFAFSAAPSAQDETCEYCTWCNGGSEVCCAPTWIGYGGWTACEAFADHCHVSSEDPDCSRENQ